MSDAPDKPDQADQASDRARFAACEFIARWVRETGEVLSPIVMDRMLFAYEMGYLRGGSDAVENTTKMLDGRKGS